MSPTGVGVRWCEPVARSVVLVVALGGLLAAIAVAAQAYNTLEPCGEVRNPGAAGFWRAERPMPTQYDEPRAVRVGGYAYLAGGIADIDPRTYQATSVDQFLRYDLQTAEYQQMAPMPMRLSHVGITSYDGDIYVAGGLTDDLITPGATARAFRYITAENRWVEIASLPAPRGALGLVTVGHHMYAISGVPQGPPGGTQQTAARTAATDAYDFNTGAWTPRRPIPTARDHLGVTAYNGKIYSVGGRTAHNYARSEFERYDPATDTWATLPPIPMGSSGVQMVPVNDRLVVASGGDDITNWVDGRVFAYDPATMLWGQLPSIPKPVHGYAATEHAGRLRVFGGSECASFAPITNTESLDVPRAPPPPPPPPPPSKQGLLVVKDASVLGSGDSALKARLAGLGYAVTVRSETAAASDAAGKDLVLISATVASTSVNTKFRAGTVPVLVSEPQLFDDMGMTTTAATSNGVTDAQTQLAIAAGSHPLAAGLTGTRTITTTAQTFNWGAPGAAAAKGATIAGDPAKAATFGYESGAAMPGLSAPGRRVGFFVSNTTAATLTTDGWKLFDAAVRWADG